MFYPDVPTPDEIKTFRISHGLANYQAANLINVNLSSWTRYESGNMKPSVFNWALLLNAVGALDLPPDDPLTPFAHRALSFVPPVGLKAGNEREGYFAPTPEQISKLRQAAGLTRVQCNQLLGLKSATHWGKYERGEIVMPEREWVIFQVALGVISPPDFSDFETALKKVPSYKKAEFIPPTPEEIKAFLKDNGLTQAKAAACLGIGERSFRRYVSSKNPCMISEKNWKLLEQLNKEKTVLPENPDSSGFPEPKPVSTTEEIQAAFSDLVHTADVVKKSNSKREIDLLPTFEIQFALIQQSNQSALFFRFPDYVNNCWSMWDGFLIPGSETHGLLAKLSKRIGSINITFKT